MNDARLFTTDAQRARAVELRRLMLRIENGAGEDHALAADILDTLDAPVLVGDVTGCIDCAWHLARWLRQPATNVCEMATRELAARVKRGWKAAEDVTIPDAARAITLILLRIELAKTERAPA